MLILDRGEGWTPCLLFNFLIEFSRLLGVRISSDWLLKISLGFMIMSINSRTSNSSISEIGPKRHEK